MIVDVRLEPMSAGAVTAQVSDASGTAGKEYVLDRTSQRIESDGPITITQLDEYAATVTIIHAGPPESEALSVSGPSIGIVRLSPATNASYGWSVSAELGPGDTVTIDRWQEDGGTA